MMKDKQFDCVKMKWDIQQEIAKEGSGLSDEQAHKQQMENIKKNPLLRRFYPRLSSKTDTRL